MYGFAATKLNEFEQGKISRRKLIETLTLAATATAAAESAQAQESPLKAQLINHLSYTCPDFKKAADWYSMVLNCDQVGQTKRDVVVVFGKKGEQPYNVTAKDVPLTFIIMRTRDLNAPPANGAAPRPKATNVVNHMAYTVADFDSARVQAELKTLGVENIRATGANAIHMTDPFGYDVEICGLANSALTDGA